MIALLCLGSAAGAFAQQTNEQLTQRIHAFSSSTHSKAAFLRNTTKVVTHEKCDRVERRDARWTLLSVNGAAHSADELQRHRKDAAKGPVVLGLQGAVN